jgi:alpha-glucuronidase
MKSLKEVLIVLLFLVSSAGLKADDGYRLWLRYDVITEQRILNQYSKNISGYMITCSSPTLKVTGTELQMGLNGLLGKKIPLVSAVKTDGIVIAGTPEASEIIASLNLKERLAKLKEDGFIILNTVYKNKQVIVIAANKDLGVLYGTFHFLRLMQMHQDISNLDIAEYPNTKIRILNHWDNLDSSVERGYAGRSIWNWKSLPDSISQRYIDYARANASIGINGTVLTNVNANALILTKEYLVKVASLANVFRPYGIKVYLAARYSAPIEIGNLKTADAHNPQVIEWWNRKAAEIYSLIPDFGGFIVKANSEGQPGPQNYKQTHADGANLLADAVAPYNGIIMWRAFVYDNNVPDDRVKQAYNEFVPFDGMFRKNVIIQVKNGPLDFQPREPFSPLFGAMQKTPLMMEFQITQEYLGFAVYLVFKAPLYEECLKSDTYAKGKGSLVAKVIDGTLMDQSLTGIAGVSNIGVSKNWTGHPFGQANWYTFGRQAWDPYLRSRDIANEWIRMTFSNDNEFIERVTRIMLSSREIAVNFMTPIGLHHIMSTAIHYGPGPWVDDLRRDWNPVYYHRADSEGIGFERSSKGSNAVAQYFPPVRDLYDKLETCPENLLLWFHHVPWDYKMKSGRNVWEELCYRYNLGVDSVRWMQNEWNKSKGMIDNERFEIVQNLLVKQEENARVWRDACLLYFQTFSGRPIPGNYEKPENTLEYYKSIKWTSQW